MAAKLTLIFTFSAIVLHNCVLCSHDYDPKLRIQTCIKQDGGCDRQQHENTVDGPCMVGRSGGLARVDGVKVGHVEEIDVGDKVVKVTTRALKPPIFEIPNFLSDEECDFLVDFAKKKRMRNSIARGGLTKKEELDVPKIGHGKAGNIFDIFGAWDTNQDGVITTKEALGFVKRNFLLQLKEDELLPIFHKVKVTELDDGIITREEFQNLDTKAMHDVLQVVIVTHPRYRHRYSEQTWYNHREDKGNPISEAIQQRVIKLTGLSKETIYGSERIQVVKYTKHGHYHAHYDSETHLRTDAPCCHMQEDLKTLFTFNNPCRICRYMTVLYYLNDVASGGETAFPVADNVTLDTQFMQNSRGTFDHYNLNENCKYSNMVIKPRKGLAVMWYNHLLDDEGRWMGPMDDYSLHGGCELHQGEKWIANSWITAPFKEDAHKGSLWLKTLEFADG